jgi:hypothetical protein
MALLLTFGSEQHALFSFSAPRQLLLGREKSTFCNLLPHVLDFRTNPYINRLHSKYRCRGPSGAPGSSRSSLTFGSRRS